MFDLFFLFHLVDFSFLSATDSLETCLNDIVKILESLYLLSLVFLNAVFVDFFLELIVIFSETNIVLITIINVLQKATKATTYTLVGGSVEGTLLSISPAVEYPGVNESQIRFSRGYGYKMPLDWAKRTILNSYLDKSTMESLAQRYGGTEKILDCNSFCDIMKEEKEIIEQLSNSITPMEQRVLELRKY